MFKFAIKVKTKKDCFILKMLQYIKSIGGKGGKHLFLKFDFIL